MKKIKICLLVLTLLFAIHCKKNACNEGPKILMSSGIKHVYNPAAPRDGSIVLEIKKTFEIDSKDIESETPVFFHQVTHGPDGSIFLMDGKAVRIYKFSPTGELLGHFVSKGNGPAEFPYLGRIEINENKIWVSGAQKLASFDENGTFICEKRFKKNYWPIDIIDSKRFLGNFTWIKTGKKIPGRMVAVLDMDENILTSILKSDITGMIRVEKDGFKLAFDNVLVTPNILTLYNRLNGLVYIAVTDEYKIILKDIKGDIRQLIFRDYQNKRLSRKDRSTIASMFNYLPARERKIVEENLPGTFCAIKTMQFLRWGYLAISRITGVNSLEIDIFDSNGVYVYLVKLPEGIPDLFLFHENKLVVIEQNDSSSVYEEYQITNLPALFGK